MRYILLHSKTAYYFLFIAFLAKAAIAGPCDLVKDIRSGKLMAAEMKILAGQNPFKDCKSLKLTPSHLGVQRAPQSSLTKVIIDYYLSHPEIEANVLGSLSAPGNQILSKSIEERFTLFQSAIIGGVALDFGKKKGFDPNFRAKIVTSEGEEPETALGLFYSSFFKKKFESASEMLANEESRLEKFGANFTNCQVLAEIQGHDSNEVVLRKGPGKEFAISETIPSRKTSKNYAAVLISGYHLKGWFQVTHLFSDGYDNMSQLNSCTLQKGFKSGSWIHGSMVRFRDWNNQYSTTDIVRNLCFGETTVALLKNKTAQISSTRSLLNTLPDLTLPCDK